MAKNYEDLFFDSVFGTLRINIAGGVTGRETTLVTHCVLYLGNLNHIKKSTVLPQYMSSLHTALNAGMHTIMCGAVHIAKCGTLGVYNCYCTLGVCQCYYILGCIIAIGH